MSESAEDDPFAVRAELRADHVRVLVTGELDHYREADLRAACERILAEDTPERLVLDVRELHFLDSSGMRALLVCRDRARACGVPFRLAVAPVPVTRLLAVAGVEDWFEYE